MMSDSTTTCTETIYNAVLKRNDAYSKLSELVMAADKFNTKEKDVDVIQEYLRLSKNCQEIVDLIRNVPNTSAKDAAILFDVVTSILIRTANDLKHFNTVGSSFVTAVLTFGIHTIYNFLKPQQRPSRMRTTLRLLSSLVAQGPQAARDVFVKVNLPDANFAHLLQKSNQSVEDDIRTSFLNLIVLLLTVGDNVLIRQILETKGFLNGIFPGFVHDRPTTIMIVLDTFYEKIVNNSTIAKTSKVRLFNDYTLKFIIQLYEWKGTVKVRKAAKRKLGDDDDVQIVETTNNTIEAVRLAAHKFMMGVCCSYKNGIVFRDLSYGFSGRNQNHIITNVLTSISHPYSNPLLFELVVSVLKTCPDQLKYYLPCLTDSLLPRLSVPWIQAVELLKEIVLSINFCSCLFETGEKKAVSKLASIARQFCIPEVVTVSHFSDSFKDGHPIVCSCLLDYLHCVLKCVSELLAYCKVPSKNSMYSLQELSEFSRAFILLVKKSLPEFALIERYWCRRINMDLEVEEEDKTIANKSPPFSLQIYQILEVLKIYINMFQGVCQNVGAFVQSIFNGLKKILPGIKDDSFQLEIIDVVSAFIPAETYVAMQNESFLPLIMVLDLYLATEDPKKMTRVKFIIFKLLSNACTFDEYPWELDLWLKYLKTSNEGNQKILADFFAETLISFVKQEVRTLNNKKKGIKFKFSSLVPVALQCLTSLEANCDLCSAYVEFVLKLFMHHHLEPKSVLALIENYSCSISENVMRYLRLLSNYKETDKAKDIQLCFVNTPATCNEAFQNVFIASKLGMKAKKLKSHFKELFKKLQNEDFTEIASLLWQSLAYINLEASVLWDTSRAVNKTEIEFYASVLEDLITLSQNVANENLFFNCEVDIKEFAFPLRSFRYSVVETILCHPAIMKCFLFRPDNFIFERTMKPFMAITTVVLHLLEKYCNDSSSCDKELLIPIKMKAVNFCDAFFTHMYGNDTLSLSFWNVVETLVIQFPFLFSCQNVISFISRYLSLDDKHLQMFDPKLNVLGQLVDIYCKDEEYLLLSPSCARALLQKFFSLKEKKRRQFTEMSISRLLKKHPVYTLALKSGDTFSYFKKHSFSDLEIRGDLITHNVAFRDGASIQQMLSNLGNGDACDEDEYALHLVTKFCDQNSLSSRKEIIAFLKSIADDYWKCFIKKIVNVTSDDLHLPTSNIRSLIALLRDENIIGETHLNNLVEELLLMSKSEQIIPVASKMQLLLEIFSDWEDMWFSSSLFELIMNLLQTNLLSVHSTTLNESLVKFSLNLIKKSESHYIQNYFKSSSKWQNFVQAILKEAFRNVNSGDVLLNILSCICEKLSIVTGSKTIIKKKEKIKMIYDLITSHSSFFPVMLNENDQYQLLKGGVLSLIINLLKANGELCKDTHVPLLLASYNGTLSSNDQKLLLLLKFYEDQGTDMAQFSPFIWSSSAITHYSVNKNVKYVLWRQPLIQEVLNLFNKEMFNSTAINFPLDLKYEMQIYENEEFKPQGEKIYDPRFVLPLISVLLSPGSYVNCRDFIESGALGFLFRSLSSQDSDMRALGYYCLTQFYTHLQQPKSKQCQIWIALLDSIRYSIESSNVRIPSIVSLFLTKAVNIIIKPDNHMYTAIYKFLAVKPNLDLMQVPEFYKLFNSIEIEHRVQRSWILSLIGEGLQSSLDFHLCQKRYLFTILLPYYNSALSIETEKVKILRIILSCVKIYSSARSLCQAGLLTWLDNIIKDSDIKDSSILMLLNDVMIELWSVSYQNYVDVESDNTNCSSNEKEDHFSESNICENSNGDNKGNNTRGKFMYSSFCSEFLLVFLGFIPKLALLDVLGLRKYLQTLAGILKFTSCENYAEKLTINKSSLTFHHISLLVEQWQTFHNLHHTTEPISSVTHNDTDVTSLTTDEETCKVQQNFFDIVIFWTPPLKHLAFKNQYDAIVSTCVTIVNLTFKCLSSNSSSITRLSEWLLYCMDNDNKQGISKLLLSQSDKSSYCVRTILYLYERVAIYSVGKCEDVNEHIVRQLAALSSICSYLKQSEIVNQELVTLQSFLENKLT